jgi:hypothetical protein
VNFFHWTATFHSRSEVWIPYGEWPPAASCQWPQNCERPPASRENGHAKYFFSAEAIMASKRVRGAVWFVSNCGTVSRREVAVERLSKSTVLVFPENLTKIIFFDKYPLKNKNKILQLKIIEIIFKFI